MSASEGRSGEGEAEAGGPVGSDPDVLAGELAVLREENERLREEYARARQSQYRQSAATLASVGVLALLAGAVVASARTVLFALGGTGVFLGVLVYFLTPERFLSATVGEAVYASLARNEERTVAELGLADERVYVPGVTAEGDGAAGPNEVPGNVRLFVPHHADYAVPDAGALTDRFVVTDDPAERGLSARPTARDLYADFAQAVTGDPSDDPAGRAAELSDALVEQFELAESATADVSAGEGRASVRVTGSALGRVDRFDHPVASLLGVGLARAAGAPVTVEATAADDAGDEYVVTCSWPADGETERRRDVEGA